MVLGEVEAVLRELRPPSGEQAKGLSGRSVALDEVWKAGFSANI